MAGDCIPDRRVFTHPTGWSIRKYVLTARYRTIETPYAAVPISG